MKICKKVFVKKRKTFNSKNKRILDSEHAMLVKNAEFEDKKKEKMNKNKKGKEDEEIKKLPKWKRQSEQFRNVLQQARNADQEDNNNFVVTKGGNSGGVGGGVGGGKGKGIGSGPGSGSGGGLGGMYDDDYTHCDICNRRYNENAYTKHLPTCQRKQKEMMMKGGNKGNTGNTGNSSKPNLNVKFNKK